ncbi:glycosyltransferase family 2 protein [Liquorilactobacillus satsumensis]|uniref:glycosyltransferase family 2 protein n=1 Tax=Liquorilactobacillus satsumensis TaxID=259059 RepID=UPI0021C40B41|nr:glycosyltransferase [Liquorilactobacillus satsumensis]MCP9311957.1 glycosyltransferase family 2 protein [Liquorilactobacillus satsumensis]MCP9359090.1 glycosyltransferase family 2 protein [Liquorilactobacillus satsumensis]
MINQMVMIITLISIWLSLGLSLVILTGATHFWLKNSHVRATVTQLSQAPLISIVVPAHNEEVVISQTVQAILNMNYPQAAVELLLFADNCEDQTYQVMQATAQLAQYRKRNIKIIKRSGSGGKAGVLNDALKIAHGEYIAVYDADAMPEKNALYFLVAKALEDPERYVAAFGRNKTRNATQNFLTRCINQEIIVTQRIQHIGLWHLFKIGRIPGTNFIIKTEFVKKIGGWRNGALTEDTDISFKIMQSGKLIALAYNSEAFQQEPETLKTYYLQRKRWAKGNYEVVLSNFKHLFDSSNWRVKLETFYYVCTFLWFNCAIILSDIIFFSNAAILAAGIFIPNLQLPFMFSASNIYITQILFFNWALMILLYLLQISIALVTQFGQATSEQIWLGLASYFSYSQLFIIVSISAVVSVTLDRLLRRDGNVWVKTKRFDD